MRLRARTSTTETVHEPARAGSPTWAASSRARRGSYARPFGRTPTPVRPRAITLYDLDAATRVVSFGCDVMPPRGQRVEQWDVPAVSDGYEAARTRIVANVERLVAELAGGR